MSCAPGPVASALNGVFSKAIAEGRHYCNDGKNFISTGAHMKYKLRLHEGTTPGKKTDANYISTSPTSITRRCTFLLRHAPFTTAGDIYINVEYFGLRRVRGAAVFDSRQSTERSSLSNCLATKILRCVHLLLRRGHEQSLERSILSMVTAQACRARPQEFSRNDAPVYTRQGAVVQVFFPWLCIGLRLLRMDYRTFRCALRLLLV